MQTNKFKNFPVEILEKIKERVEEANNTFDIEKLDDSYEKSGTFSLEKSFPFGGTVEGFDFWINVINHQNFKMFYDKYPTKLFQSYCSYPSEIVGTKYLWTANQIVTLKNNDGSNMPLFLVNEEETMFIPWDQLRRYASPMFKIGQKVKILKNEYNKDQTCIGKILEIVDQAAADFLNQGRSATLSYQGNNNFFNINFKPEWLEIIEKEELGFKPGTSYPEEVEGTKYLCISGDHKGKIVTLTGQDQSRCPKFKVRGNTDVHYIFWSKLQRMQISEFKQKIEGKYRIKTFEEFESQLPTGWVNSMSHLYGYVLNEEEQENYFAALKAEESGFRTSERWFIKCYDIKPEDSGTKINKIINVEKNSITESLLFGVHTTICHRPAPRGASISCTGGQILLGN